jgi:hypothetical protein
VADGFGDTDDAVRVLVAVGRDGCLNRGGPIEVGQERRGQCASWNGQGKREGARCDRKQAARRQPACRPMPEEPPGCGTLPRGQEGKERAETMHCCPGMTSSRSRWTVFPCGRDRGPSVITLGLRATGQNGLARRQIFSTSAPVTPHTAFSVLEEVEVGAQVRLKYPFGIEFSPSASRRFERVRMLGSAAS